MSIIQLIDKEGDGPASGCDFLHKFDGLGDSPQWSTRDRAVDVPNANEVAAYITEKYGRPFRCIAGDNIDNIKDEILRKMKSGELPKDEAIRLLREHASSISIRERNLPLQDQNRSKEVA